jgi:hypothetical protein
MRPAAFPRFSLLGRGMAPGHRSREPYATVQVSYGPRGHDDARQETAPDIPPPVSERQQVIRPHVLSGQPVSAS